MVFYSLPFELKLHTLWIHNDIERQSQRGAGRDRQRVRERDRESVCGAVGCIVLRTKRKERKKKKKFDELTRKLAWISQELVCCV